MLRKRTLGNSKKYTYTVYSNCNGATVNFNNSPVGVISGGKFIYTTSVNSTYDVSLSNVSLPGSYTYTSERSGSGSDYSYGTYSPSTYSVELTLNPDTGKLRIVVNFDSAPRYFDVHYSTPYTCTFVDTHEVSYTSPGTGRVHRLVAEAFIPNPNNLSDVDHIDENKNNNSVENLRWLSHKENSSRSNTNRTKDNSLGKNPRSKKVYDNKGNEYSCLKELSNLLNINYSTLRSRFRKSNKLEINNILYSYDKTIFEKDI